MVSPRVKRSVPLALAALSVLAAPSAASARIESIPSTPTVKSVKPLSLRVGERLTIHGTGFLKGRNRNTVVFKREGKRAVFARAVTASTTRLVVRVPSKLAPFLVRRGGSARPTRFRLRVLARRLSKSYTTPRRSPVIAPVLPKAPATTSPGETPSPKLTDCDLDGVLNTVDGDDDGDQLSDDLEVRVGTKPCEADSDGDQVGDAFEYESALDLNSRAVPYPGKKPYPNPLDGTDANVDFDQDGLPLNVEHLLWQATGNSTLPLTYSDGDQDTNRDGQRTPRPGNPDLARLDLDRDGYLTDDEKDADGDLLGNWVELSGPMRIGWWKAVYEGEKQYVGGQGASLLYETSLLDRDSDGDGVLDGIDDQDHDGFANRDELSRRDTGDWVHAYNPCLPNPYSRTCSLHPPVKDPWAPFGSVLPDPPGPGDEPVVLPAP
jgi:hypothetical protein